MLVAVSTIKAEREREREREREGGRERERERQGEYCRIKQQFQLWAVVHKNTIIFA